MLYSFTIFLHSWLRWAVLALMMALFIKSLWGWRNSLDYWRADNVMRVATVIVFDLQVIKLSFDPQSHFMKDDQLRFYTLEHTFMIVVALIVMHVGNVFIKKSDTPRKKFKRTAIILLAVLIIVLVSIPWPGLPYGRVLFRTL